ncbi:lysophospholipid acyltransferase family protein [Arcobacter sp.]|uniref:LpxL/LpxP family acyltransferase n=2 Tax=Arcobacter sp. TaxID=1872629 RepID=UPI003D11EF6F
MQTKQRGSGWSIQLVFNMYKIFGYNFIYYLMYPVTFFYFIFASNVKESLKIYYETLGLKFTNLIYFEHLRMFAICMVDRFISKVSPSDYKYIYDDKEELTDILNSGKILLLSHYGGWATASNTPHIKNKINIVMKEVLLNSIKNIENSIENKNYKVNIIDLNEGGVSSSIKIANALLSDEIVAMMGDRSNEKKYNEKVKFFDKYAGFNKNPFQIAYKLKKPIVIFFVSNIAKQTYEVKYFNIELNFNLKEKEAIDIAIKEYVKLFEDILLKYPNQWFNFYNFWGE